MRSVLIAHHIRFIGSRDWRLTRREKIQIKCTHNCKLLAPTYFNALYSAVPLACAACSPVLIVSDNLLLVVYVLQAQSDIANTGKKLQAKIQCFIQRIGFLSLARGSIWWQATLEGALIISQQQQQQKKTSTKLTTGGKWKKTQNQE